jgi:hypothetical protein
MSRQQEEFKKLANDILKRAARETGPYRDVLLGVAEAYATLAFHQGVLDDWPRLYPAPPPDGNRPVFGRDANASGRASRSPARA